jgi:hypothetical protein
MVLEERREINDEKEGTEKNLPVRCFKIVLLLLGVQCLQFY